MTKKIPVILTIVAVVLLAACVIVYVAEDRKKPVIEIAEMNIAYTEGDDYDSLLVGVTAYDNGTVDLTDEVRIYSVAVTESGNKAVVTYAVYDDNDNLAKATRTIQYKRQD